MEKTLECMFEFCLGPHTKTYIQEIIGLMGAFVGSINDEFTKNEIQVINKDENNPDRECRGWFTTYGCALLFERLRHNKAAISVIAVDGWQHRVNNKTDKHIAHSTSTLILFAGYLRPGKFEDFQLNLKVIFEGGIKHQMNPAFVLARVVDAIKITNARKDKNNQGKEDVKRDLTIPKGGTTDVGMRTGSEYRDTSWPLIKALFRELLNPCDDFECLDGKFTVRFMDYLTNQAIKNNFNDELVFAIIERTSRVLLDLIDNNFVIDAEVAILASTRNNFDRWQQEKADLLASQYTLDIPDICNRPPKFICLETLPVLDVVDEIVMDAKKIRKLVAENIDLVTYIDICITTTFVSIFEWIETLSTSMASKLHVLQNVQTLFFIKSANLISATTAAECRTMALVVTKYQEILQSILEEREDAYLVEMRSNELLVVWIACCISYRSAELKFPLLSTRGFPISANDLSNLVLSQKSAINALLNVGKYIRTKEKLPALFSLNVQAPTIIFARDFAADYPKIVQKFKDESSNTAIKLKEYWEKVVSQKEMVSQYRRTLSDLKSSMAVLCRKRDTMQRESDNEPDSNNYIQRTKQEYSAHKKLKESLNIDIDQKSRSIQSTESSIKYNLRTPGTIISALPKSFETAREILFFLFMPAEFRLFANLTLKAQFMLVPRRPWTKKFNYSLVIDAAKKGNSWRSHFNAHTTIQESSVKSLFINAIGLRIPKSFCPDSIDDIFEESQMVWHPDGVSSVMYWDKGNPYSISPALTRSFYTTILTPEYQGFSWMIASPDTESLTRGNLVYAQQARCPPTLLKSCFLTLGALRVGPKQQLRKLLSALHGRTLTLSNSLVQDIVLLIVLNVGSLSDNPDAQLDWKTDFKTNGGAKISFDILKSYLAELKDLSTDHQQFVIISKLALCFEQYGMKGLSFEFSKESFNWALRRLDKGRAEQNESIILDIQLDECKFYGFTILALSSATLDKDSILLLLKAWLRLQKLINFCKDAQSLTATLFECRIALSRQIDSIRAAINRNSYILTEAIKFAFDITNDGCNTMVWTIFKAQAPIYETQYQSQTYSVNVMTGLVLIDGYPLSHLPLSIRAHSVFKKIFAESDFQALQKASIFITKMVNGFSFELSLRNKSLKVKQMYEPSGLVLELISPEYFELCCPDFMIGSQSQFSHWYFESHRIFLIMRSDFKCKSILFICTTSAMYVMEPHYELCNLDLVKKDYENSNRLLDSNNYVDLITVLTKFEVSQYIQISINISDAFSITFPRFGLSFVLQNDMKFHSAQIKGYYLNHTQQLKDALPSFRSYLLLESISQDPKLATQKIVTSNESVTKKDNRTIMVPAIGWCTNLKINIFEVHDILNILTASTISARLHLVAIFSACGPVPDIFFNSSGYELAISTLRKCKSSRPFEKNEIARLDNVKRLANACSTLLMLAGHLVEVSYHCAFLFQKKSRIVEFHLDASIEYLEKKTKIMNARLFLAKKEEILILGTVHAQKLLLSTFGLKFALPELNFVPRIELFLSEHFIKLKSRRYKSNPIKLNPLNSFERELSNETASSWKSHMSLKDTEKLVFEDKFLTDIINVVFKKERELYSSIQNVYSQYLESQNNIQISFLSNIFPRLTMEDILRFAFDHEYICTFFALRSSSVVKPLQDLVRGYLQVLVLLEKLKRMLYFHRLQADSSFCQEVLCKRLFDSEKHPYWLVFEVENRLQIRPEQFHMVEHLINNPGSIAQLNMGLGKTRVLIPMLILYWVLFSNKANNNAPEIVRLNLLSTLLKEGVDYLHLKLTASVLSIQVFEQPYCRDIDLRPQDLALLRESIEYCQDVKGVQAVSPEHRVSLDLKLKEMEINQGKPLELYNRGCIDILDESDLLLSHKYQVCYAIGLQKNLPDASSRWDIAESLLLIISSDPVIQDFLDGKSTHSSFVDDRFNNVRLYQPMLDKDSETLGLMIVQGILNSPLKQFVWLSSMCKDSTFASKFIRFCLDTSDDADCIISSELVSASQMTHLLILRGLIGHKVLEHCLGRRYRVNYGFDPLRKNEIAVPFSATDVPKKADFDHPDVNIVLTILSFYQQGLTIEEYRINMNHLISNRDDKNNALSQHWYPGIQESLENNKIDPGDKTQEIRLFNILKCSISFINSYLNFFVFPSGTYHYDQKMSGSAWDLASSHRVNGFSGTNDNSRLLPTMVKQNEPSIPSLLATNGRMIDLILENSRLVFAQPTPNPEHVALLEYVCNADFDALIDSGSVLAGISNLQVAQQLVNSNNFAKDVMFFDVDRDSWMVLHKKASGMAVVRQDCNLDDEDVFILFDDARTRGVDMKMSKTSNAILTLGPNLLKDKLVQAAGRLRHIGQDQKITIHGSSEIQNTIINLLNIDETLSVTHIMNWVFTNTRIFFETGLEEWANHGINFSKAIEKIENCVSVEIITVEELYAAKVVPLPIMCKLAVLLDESSYDFEQSQEYVSQIKGTIKKYGSEVTIMSSGFDMSCEINRQTQEFKQKEIEKECMDPVGVPCKEFDWDVRTLNSALSISDLKCKLPGQLIRLSDVAVENQMSSIPWQLGNVFATINFLKTTVDSGKSLQYPRYIDFLVIFKEKEVLLLTERESERVLEYSINCNMNHKMYNNLPFLSLDTNRENFRIGAPLKSSNIDISVMKLFNGIDILSDESCVISSQIKNSRSLKGYRMWLSSRGNNQISSIVL